MLTEPLTILKVLAAILTVATLTGRSLRRFGPEIGSVDLDNLNQRIRSWWWIVAALGSAVLLGRTAVILLFAGISFVALREFLALTRLEPMDRHAVIAIFVVALPVQYLLVGIGGSAWPLCLLPFAASALVPALIAFTGNARNYLARTSELLIALLFCVCCVSFVPVLFTPGRGGGLMIFLILVTQTSDILQYLFGKLAGRHKVAPEISPAKTTEGLIAGILSATAIGASLYRMTPFTVLQAGIMAFVIALTGFVGGLVMSAIKRDRGVKDWSGFIPGHGGVLDRLDSLCFSAPLFYCLTRALLAA
jgi:phosphatidate cytidylyltransferase